MNKKQLGAVVIYIFAIALPTVALGARYGFETNVNLTNSPEALQQLLAMAAGIACGVVISLFGSRLLGSENENLLGYALRILRQMGQQNAATQR